MPIDSQHTGKEAKSAILLAIKALGMHQNDVRTSGTKLDEDGHNKNSYGHVTEQKSIIEMIQQIRDSQTRMNEEIYHSQKTICDQLTQVNGVSPLVSIDHIKFTFMQMV